MNVFNRAVVIALTVVLIAVGIVVGFGPDLVLGYLQAWTTGAVVTPRDRISSAVLGAVLVVASALVLYFELRPARRRSVVVSQLSNTAAALGTAALEVSSVSQRIRQQVEMIDGVRQATPEIDPRGRKIDVQLVVITDQDVDVPEKAGQIGEAVRATTEQMGITLGKMHISIGHEPAQAKVPQKV